MLFAITILLSLYYRELTHSRPVSRTGFHQPVETITAPRFIYNYKQLFLNLTSALSEGLGALLISLGI